MCLSVIHGDATSLSRILDTAGGWVTKAHRGWAPSKGTGGTPQVFVMDKGATVDVNAVNITRFEIGWEKRTKLSETTIVGSKQIVGRRVKFSVL